VKLSTGVKTFSALAAILMCLIVAALWWAEAKHTAANTLFYENTKIALKTKDLLQALTDRETGQRGYLLTLDQNFLEPYTAAGENVDRLMAELKPIVDQAVWTKLNDYIARRDDYFSETFALVDGPDSQRGQQKVIQQIRLGTGKYFMDEMRQILAELNAALLEQSEASERAYRTATKITDTIFIVGCLMLLMLLAAPVILIRWSVVIPLQQVTSYLAARGFDPSKTLDVGRYTAPEIKLLTQKLLSAIAESVEYDNKLKESISRLEQLQKRQDKMYAIVGHELRTPASAIKMLLDEAAREQNPRGYIKEAQVHAKQLLDVVSDMRLVVAGTESLTSADEENSLINVFSVLKSTIVALEPLATENSFALALNGSAPRSDCYEGNAKRLQQIVQNLVKNAILHSGGSAVNISFAFKHLEKDLTDFTVEIRDNGRGIPMEFQQRMFDPFERGDSSAEGTGLGLNVAKELAQDLPAGELRYEDNPEGGAIFIVRFTLKKADLAHSTAAEKTSSALNGLRVLFVEDTSTLRLLGKKLLTREGAIVETATDGEDALDVLKDFDADVVATDIMMPKMTGYELTETLRKRGFKKPIIGVTGAVIGSDAQKLIDCGADRVLAKPITVEDFSNALESMFGSDQDDQPNLVNPD